MHIVAVNMKDYILADEVQKALSGEKSDYSFERVSTLRKLCNKASSL